MTPQELKNSILQYAIQGKLVEQREAEGTGEELYLQVQQEKSRFVKEGKIKKKKPLPDITEDEIPFDIPESWKWMRLGDCSSYSQTKKKISPSSITPDLWLLDLEDIEKETGKIIYYRKAGDKKIAGDRVFFEKGQILYCKLRPYLKKILVAPSKGIGSPELVPFSMYGNINHEYIVYVLKSPHIDYAINSVTYGVKMPRVGTATMVNLLIPIPPLAEQKRIVEKIEELLPCIDRYEEAWSKLEEFNERFPMDMQKSLLQYAIQGKLVEQREDEGTGEELYRQIQKEKARLIKEGKIKREKPLPEITENEIPFDIPESWKWVRLGDCSSYSQTKKKISLSSITPDLWSLDLEDIEKETGKILNYRKAGDKRIAGDRVIFKRGQLLYSKLRPYLKKILVAPSNGICSPELIPFSMYGNISHEYMIYVLKSPHIDYTINSVTYGVKMPRVGTATMVNLLLPIPPLAEQKRIVEKLEEFLPLCDRLK